MPKRSKGNTAPTIPSTVRSFGNFLRDLRERIGLSQEELADQLEVHASTITRFEKGSRRPPRDFQFYERLRRVPGVTNADVNALLRTDNAPAWLVASTETVGDTSDDERLNPNDYKGHPISVGGFHAWVTLRSDPGIASDQDLQALTAIIAPELELILRHFYGLQARIRSAMHDYSIQVQEQQLALDDFHNRKSYDTSPTHDIPYTLHDDKYDETDPGG